MGSKVSDEKLNSSIKNVLRASQEKRRNFVETVELLVALKNLNPPKKKRVFGTVTLEHVPRPKFRVCVFGDELHREEARQNNLDCMDIEVLKNQRKKRVRKLVKKYHAFMASESVINEVPAVLGPGLIKADKFPTVLTHEDEMTDKLDEIKTTIKIQIKKSLNFAIPVGNVTMSPEMIAVNTQLAITGLISHLTRHWDNVRSLHIKATMGPPQKLY